MFFLHVPPLKILKDWTAWKTSCLSSLEMLPSFQVTSLNCSGRVDVSCDAVFSDRFPTQWGPDERRACDDGISLL